MSLLKKVSNKINYSIAQVLNDREADEYARQQEAQEAQERAVRERQAAEAAGVSLAAAAAARDRIAAAKLEDRSQVKPGRALNRIASGILKTIFYLFLIIVICYAGHLSANEAIGYNIPFRIFSFIYGQIFFWFVIPKFLIRKYWYGLPNHNYAFLPVSTYTPITDAEKILLKPFCYVEDKNYAAAKAAVDALYYNAYQKSLILSPGEPPGPPRPACYPDPKYSAK